MNNLKIKTILKIFQPSDIESFEDSEDDGSEYSEASEDSDSEGTIFISYVFCLLTILKKKLIEEELGSSDESGKDWSDLEREAEEEDRNDFHNEYSKSKSAGSSGSHFKSSSHKKSSSNKHR